MFRSPLLGAIRQAINEFTVNTSIHGVRYIGETGRKWVERFVWIATEMVCVCCAVYMLLYLLSKFNDNPTMTRVETYFHEVSDVPFPAITLCNVNRIQRSRAERLVDRLKVPKGSVQTREEVIGLLPLLGQLLSDPSLGPDVIGRTKLDRILKHNNLTSDMVLEEVGQPCSELIERCCWEGREVSCHSIITKTVAYLGHCCSFNAARDLSVPRATNVMRQSMKTPFFGYPMGLTVLLNPQIEDYFWGPLSSAGIVCAVHDSNEMATERAEQAMVAIGQESMVQILPRIQNASRTLRTVSPERRRCLFEDENPLSETEDYSFEECTLECEARRIWKACGCRPVNFPRISGPRGTICGLPKLTCLAKFQEVEHNRLLQSQIRGSDLPSHPVDAEALSEAKFQACGCLAQCNSVHYDLETTTGDFGASLSVGRSFYKHMNATGRSLLHVYFECQTSALFINDLVSNTVQLMSSFGGIFSLFLGCSFMSAVEVMYFFTVRLWLLFRGQEAEAEEGPPDELAIISPQSSKYDWLLIVKGVCLPINPLSCL